MFLEDIILKVGSLDLLGQVLREPKANAGRERLGWVGIC